MTEAICDGIDAIELNSNHVGSIETHVTQSRPLYPPLDDPGRDLTLWRVQVRSDDRSVDIRYGVDDLLDSRHSHCNVH